MNEKLVEIIRERYQSQMRYAVSNIRNYLNNTETISMDIVDEVDFEIGRFQNAKDKATHFEAIIKNLSERGELKKNNE
jgi:intracellular sulfur oxidation DsrE/DsrF family protein